MLKGGTKVPPLDSPSPVKPFTGGSAQGALAAEFLPRARARQKRFHWFHAVRGAKGVVTRERGKNDFSYFAPAGAKGVIARERPPRRISIGFAPAGVK